MYSVKRIVTVGGCLWLLCACGERQHPVRELYGREVNIPVTYSYLTQYTGTANVWQKNDTLFLAGYNYFTHTIDILNITARKPVKNVSLEKQGPNPVPFIKNMWVQDSLIFIKDFTSFLTLNWKGRILEKIEDRQLASDIGSGDYGFSAEGIHVGNYRYFYYNSDTRTFFYQLYPKSKEWRTYAVGVKFGLNTGKYELLPVYYPDNFNYEFISSTLGAPQFCQQDHLIIFNFAYSSKVYCYNELTKELHTYNPSSVFIPEKLPLSVFLKAEHRDRSRVELDCARYRHLFYHKNLKVYSRVHYGEKKEKIRKKYLMLLDHSFNVMVEYTLPDFFADDFFVSEDYIVFQIKSGKDSPEEVLRLAVVNLADELKIMY